MDLEAVEVEMEEDGGDTVDSKGSVASKREY